MDKLKLLCIEIVALWIIIVAMPAWHIYNDFKAILFSMYSFLAGMCAYSMISGLLEEKKFKLRR